MFIQMHIQTQMLNKVNRLIIITATISYDSVVLFESFSTFALGELNTVLIADVYSEADPYADMLNLSVHVSQIQVHKIQRLFFFPKYLNLKYLS